MFRVIEKACGLFVVEALLMNVLRSIKSQTLEQLRQNSFFPQTQDHSETERRWRRNTTTLWVGYRRCRLTRRSCCQSSSYGIGPTQSSGQKGVSL